MANLTGVAVSGLAGLAYGHTIVTNVYIYICDVILSSLSWVFSVSSSNYHSLPFC